MRQPQDIATARELAAAREISAVREIAAARKLAAAKEFAAPRKVAPGIDSLCEIENKVAGAKVGLVTSPTGVTSKLRPDSEVIGRLCRLEIIFSPEHGLDGSAQAGLGDPSAKGDNYPRDPVSGVGIYSLYGGRTAPDGDILSQLDYVMYDIQDVGARFYTYLTTLTRTMSACAASKVPMIIFDRPCMPGLSRCEGGMLDERFSSFVGEYAIPVRFGMTPGEYALYINDTRSIGCDLTVVACEGLRRDMCYSDTGLPFISPSPNIPSEDCALNYLGTCIFEGTNVSEGRGTTLPFSAIGAPWIDPERLISRMERYGFGGVALRRVVFTPQSSKYAGTPCRGVQLHVTDRRRYQPFEFGLRLFDEIRALFPEFSVSEGIDRLFGSDVLRKSCFGAEKISDYLAANEYPLERFRETSAGYRLYR